MNLFVPQLSICYTEPDIFLLIRYGSVFLESATFQPFFIGSHDLTLSTAALPYFEM